MPLKTRVVAVFFILLAAAAGLVAASLTSSTRPYSVYNTGGDGASNLAGLPGVMVVADLSGLQGFNPASHVLITGRENPLTPAEAGYLKGFAEKGGVVIAYGSRGFTESLLEALGVGAGVKGAVYDPVYNAGDQGLVNASTVFCGTRVVLEEPYSVSPIGAAAAAAWSSPFSYIDVDGDGSYSPGEPIGSSVVAVRVDVGGGVIIVFPARGVFANSVLHYNKGLLDCVAAGRRVLVDQSEVFRDPAELLRHLIRGQVYSPLHVALLIGLVTLVLYYVYGRH